MQETGESKVGYQISAVKSGRGKQLVGATYSWSAYEIKQLKRGKQGRARTPVEHGPTVRDMAFGTDLRHNGSLLTTYSLSTSVGVFHGTGGL